MTCAKTNGIALNPKVAMFFLAFLPQFVNPGAGPVPFLVLGAAFVNGGTAWCVLVAIFAAALSGSVRRNRRLVGWLERAAGGMYIYRGMRSAVRENEGHGASAITV